MADAVGIVIVSHSGPLAEGVAALAREMGGEDVAIAAAGGLDDGAIGTDAERVRKAIEEVRSDAGVLVLIDLGSALMSAEIAIEMLEDGGPVALSPAPLVEGAVAAAARARTGGALDEVAAEARGALAMKTSQLGDEAPAAAGEEAAGGDGLRATLPVGNRLGLHLRPAGLVAAAVGRRDARVRVRNATRGTGPVDARSLTGLAMLSARQGDELEVEAEGPEAQDALDALRALADDNWGDPPDGAGTAAAGEGAVATVGDGAAAAGEGAAATAGAPGDGAAAGVAAPGEGAAATAGDGGVASAAAGALRGARVAGGVAAGPVRHLAVAEPEIEDAPGGPPAAEQARLDAARAAVKAELEPLAGRSDIFAAHLMLLEDESLLAPTRERIGGGASASRAWADSIAELASSFRALDDPYLRERAVDVEDVGRRVLADLTGVAAAAGPSEPGILVADLLTPGQVAALDPEKVWAIAAARGGVTDHASILAANLGIPVVVGVGAALLELPEGTTVAVDGDAGTVEPDPDADTVAEIERRRAAAAEQLARAREPLTLADGRRVGVLANIGGAADVGPAIARGAEGVGLLRTEFLFLDRATAPSEDEQAQALSEIAQALDGRPLTVRTLDAGADKPLAFVHQEPEVNPYLGLRGIRLSLAEPELFATQLRAIARVAERHPLRVMFPMVATTDELFAAREALEKARSEVAPTAQLEVGVMVEVPALALQASEFAPHVDFFSVGTNDLSQYTMAAERGNATLAPLLEQALEPVLQLIASTTAAAAEHGAKVSVCGELAGDPEVAPRLLAVGVDELSMASGRIPALKAALRGAALR